MAKSCFLGREEIQFRAPDGSQKYLHAKKLTEENYSTKRSGEGSLMIGGGGGGFSSSRKLKLQFVSGQQKAADYVKMLNDLSLVQDGRRLCREEWIFSKIILPCTMHQ